MISDFFALPRRRIR